MADSGVVVAFIGFVRFAIAAIPGNWLGETNFMKRKNPPCESGAEQNKNTGPRAFRTHGDFSVGKRRKSLPKFATLGTKQRDINAREQWSLRVALSYCHVRRNLMRPIGY